MAHITFRIAGLARIAAAGLIAAPLAVAPLTAATPAPAAVHAQVSLTAGEWQAALQSLLDEMATAVAKDAALPYAPAGSQDVLMTMLQNTNYQNLTAGLSRVTEWFNGWFFQSPEVIAADAADSRQYFNFFTPDINYHVTAGLAPGATYELTGKLGGATEYLTISATKITGGSADAVGVLELGHNLHVNPDGTFSVIIGPDDPGSGNYLDDTDATTSGAASLLIRDMMGDWAKGPASIGIRCIDDCPPFFAIPSGGLLPGVDDGADGALDAPKVDSLDSLLAMLFNAFATITPSFNDLNISIAESAGILLPENTMADVQPETGFGVGLESARVAFGNFNLQPGEALVVKMPDIPSAYSGIELMNVFGGALPYTLAQTTLNNTTAYQADDGFTYYVISATNPGVANWLDSGDVTRGEIFARYENVDDPDAALGQAVQTFVVPVDDVRSVLPDDTPDVSPAEFAADMARRVFSYDYALDISRMNAQPDWITQQLLMFGLSGLVGKENFEAAFGVEPSIPLELRLTDALSPDWEAVAAAFHENPDASFTALFDSLPLLFNDISQPITLALLKGVLALVLPEGPSFDEYLHQILLDSASSITAGLFNTRDDFATAILSANDAWPTELGSQAAEQWGDIHGVIDDLGPSELSGLGALLSGLFSG